MTSAFICISEIQDAILPDSDIEMLILNLMKTQYIEKY